MYNLLVKSSGWNDHTDEMFCTRVFEYTESYVRDNFTLGDRVDFDKMKKFPCLFMQETRYDETQQNARVGMITSVVKSGNVFKIEYAFDNSIPPLTNQKIEDVSGEFDIDNFEFHRTHWAVKDIDLFKVLHRHQKPRRHMPRVFNISEVEHIEPKLVSVMMPLDQSFDGVYATSEVGIRWFGPRLSSCG